MDIREETINRMLRILEKFSRKLKIAICVPKLVEKPSFKNIFQRRNMKLFKKLQKLCIAANREHDEKSIQDCSTKESTQVALLNYEHYKTELEWAVILESLCEYQDEILSIINETFDEIPRSYASTIKHVELLKQTVEWQMRITPKQLRERRVLLRNAEALFTKTEREIKNLESDFSDETRKHKSTIEKSKDEIEDLKSIIDEIKSKHGEELDHEMNCYKKTLRGLRDDIIEQENSLDKQLEAHEIMLEKLTQANVEQEKLLRECCIKAEKKYLVARNAYDRDLSKLNELKETLGMQLCITTNHYEILKNEYDVQSVLFINLKKERELAMMQAFAEQLDNFEKNRAARIIQRTWRAYHERISAKKKKRTRRNK